MQPCLKDEGDRHCWVRLHVAWMDWKNTRINICVCKKMWKLHSFNFVQPRKQNPRYLCALVSLLDMLGRTMVLACL